jgi:endonuclease/exonuclease/phosphatase family metal-dependent hydrolase
VDGAADAVERRIDEKPHRPTIAMGDFNIHSQNGGYGDGVDNAQYFSNFMQQMQARGMQDVWLTYGGPGPENTDCNVQPDERTCDPFVSKPGQSYGDYYRGNRLDYVFVEKPRPEHDIHVDVSRVTNVIWQDWRYGTPSLSDHPGVAFDIVTSPTD